MTAPTAGSTLPVPSEPNDGVDDVTLPFRHIGPTLASFSCGPNYSKSWTLRSNFLHLQEREVHMATGGISLICICRLVQLWIFGPGRTLRSRYGRTTLRITPAGCQLAPAQRQMDEDLQGGGEERWCDVEGN
jgi:hypothetical protein